MMDYVLPSCIAAVCAQLPVVIQMPQLLQSLAFASPLLQTLDSGGLGPSISGQAVSTPECCQPVKPISPLSLILMPPNHTLLRTCGLPSYLDYIGSWVSLPQPILLSLSFCLDASWSFCFQNPKTPSLMILFCLPAISRKSSQVLNASNKL